MGELFEMKVDNEWLRFMEGDANGKRAHMVALNVAAGKAVDEVEKNFDQIGRPRWKGLTKKYRNRKRSGKVAPGLQQQSTSRGLGDLVLTGALKYASAEKPIVKITPQEITIRPNPAIKRGKANVGKYADAMNRVRPFMTLVSSAKAVITRAYRKAFVNFLVYGVVNRKRRRRR